MAGFLSKIFGAGAPGSRDRLFGLLEDLDKWERGLTARAVTYIREGDGRPVLSAIAATRPGNTNNNTNYRVLQANMATENGYAHHFGQRPEQLVRYCEVIIAKRRMTPNRSKYSGLSGLADVTPDIVGNFTTILFLGNNRSIPDHNKWVKEPEMPTTFDDVLSALGALDGVPADLIGMTYGGRYLAGKTQVAGKSLDAHLDGLPAMHFVLAINRCKGVDKTTMLKRFEGISIAKDLGFLATLIECASATSSQLRAQAIKMLADQDPIEVEKRILPALSKGAAAGRGGAVQVLGAIGSDTGLAAMKDRLEVEKSQDIIAAIQFYVGGNEAENDVAPEGTYTAHDGSLVDIPNVEPLVDDGSKPFDQSDLEELRRLDGVSLENEMRRYENQLARYKDPNAKYAKTKPTKPTLHKSGERLFELLNDPYNLTLFNKLYGAKNNGGYQHTHFYYDHSLVPWLITAVPRLPLARLLWAALSSSRSVEGAVSRGYDTIGGALLARLEDGSIDIRHVLAAAQERNAPLLYRGHQAGNVSEPTGKNFVAALLSKVNSYGGMRRMKSAWPLTIEHLPDVLAVLPPQVTNVHTNVRALEMLGDLPKLPAAAVDTVLFAALDPRPRVSTLAQKLLMDVEGIDDKVIATLTDKRQAVRAKAAVFLADRGVDRAVSAIVKRLKTEKSETARADMISAVAVLGGDTSPYLGKAALMKEAETLVGKLPNTKIEWLNLETAPSVKWSDEKPVEPVVLDAWLRLAVKVKDPKGSPLFGLYLDQFEPAGAIAFCDWVLRSWIAYDTYRPATDTLREKAQKEAEAYKAKGVGWMSKGWSVDQIAAQFLAGWTSGYSNSGSDSKGILGLTLKATPTTAAATIAAYLKQHGKRVPQAKALVEVLSVMETPEALQVLVATATRFKQRTVRELAETCVSDIAEARGWTEDELADRSVPSGGFDDTGVIPLDVGEEAKPYSARLGSDLTVKLYNPDGKEVKAIPAGKDDNTKESRALLSSAKKTVKAVAAQQATRLYDAMVGARVWPLSDWEIDIVSHPILTRLVERVIWRGLDAEGEVVVLFRPTAEGDRMTADGDDADLSKVVNVDIAHTATVSENVRQDWLTHMVDFEVTPLFAQISRPMQVLDEKQKKATAIMDREGWLTEAFKLRSAAAKANFERGPVEDGAGFSCYTKSFRTAGIRAELGFTGSYVPEENIPVAVTDLSFFKESNNMYGQAMPLGDVPGMVLSEAWNDLHDIASVGAFDDAWRNKGLY